MAATKGNAELDRVWEHVCTAFDLWVERLHIDWCTITLYRSDSRRADDEGCAADTDASWFYRHATIRVYLPAIAHLSYEDIEDIMVHELVHILVNPMEHLLPARHTNQCELAVENVARAIVESHRHVLDSANPGSTVRTTKRTEP